MGFRAQDAAPDRGVTRNWREMLVSGNRPSCGSPQVRPGCQLGGVRHRFHSDRQPPSWDRKPCPLPSVAVQQRGAQGGQVDGRMQFGGSQLNFCPGFIDKNPAENACACSTAGKALGLVQGKKPRGRVTVPRDWARGRRGVCPSFRVQRRDRGRDRRGNRDCDRGKGTRTCRFAARLCKWNLGGCLWRDRLAEEVASSRLSE